MDAPGQQPELTLKLLGEMAVIVDGKTIAMPRSKKTRALLAYLAISGRSHQREKLCSMFWHLPDDPRGALRWSLSKIRGLVDVDKEHPHLTADRNAVSFNAENVKVDVNDLRQKTRRGFDDLATEELENFAGLLGDNLLTGLDQPDMHEFQAWLVAERDELSELNVAIRQELIKRLASQPDLALEHARALAIAVPENELAQATLIASLNHAGKTREAQKQAELAINQLNQAGIDLTGALAEVSKELNLALPMTDIVSPKTPGLQSPGRASDDRRAVDDRRTKSSAAGSSNNERPSIAVLPLECMSTDRNLEFMTDGMTEDIITLLSRIPGFFVISRSSVFAYKGQRPDIRRVGADLGVRYVVEGSLRPVGANARLTVQLIEVESDTHIWADRFDQPIDTLDELQDQITSKIVAHLSPELTRAEVTRIKRQPPKSLDAWSYYQQAHGHLSMRGWRGETFAEALELLSKAIEADPDFALAHAYRSLILAVGNMFKMTSDPAQADISAAEEAETAMRIDNNDPAVLGYVGCALCDLGQTRRGIEILYRAVEYDPSNAQAWVALGTGLLSVGRAKEGVQNLKHGISISPIDQRLAYWETVLAYAVFRMGRPGEAIEIARRACRRDDQFQISRVVLAVVLAAAGNVKEAQTAVDEALRIYPDLKAEDMRGLIGRRGIKILSDAELLA
jgi:TolB-like protein/DNA-binding SARP family transcriptional activator/Tfp pilus assembly protein PilF